LTKLFVYAVSSTLVVAPLITLSNCTPATPAAPARGIAAVGVEPEVLSAVVHVAQAIG
jgi:hypothetical protein